MKYKLGKTVVVALGGSIIYPDQIDWRFLKDFKKFIKTYSRKKKFIIVVGGGRLSRTYQEAAQKVAPLANDDKDWLGIHTTRCNAHLLRTIFRKEADPVIIDNRLKFKKLNYPITIASGWRPGWSTDYVAAALTVDFSAKEFIVAGRPAYVYDKDHAIHRDAKPIYQISWPHYRKLIPNSWIPGAHAPVDPVASRLAQKEKIKAIIINGKNLENFANLLAGKNFQGTIIS